jgi:exopolysaccharide production protein ExoQ
VFWSDAPVISFKRWVKGLGTLIMALVIVTESRPFEALGFVLRRLAFVLMPLSLLFIKFYPELGRAYHMGSPMFTGVTFQKNSLGQLCLYLGIYLSWEFLFRSPDRRASRSQSIRNAILLPMTAWVLYMSHSATALALMGVALGLMLAMRTPALRCRPRSIFPIGIVALAAWVLLDATFDLQDAFIRLLGRRPDLTDRTALWAMLMQMVQHPLIGAGYESFWSGERLVQIWERMGYEASGVVQAHNGYIELYLNLGVVGVAVLALAIFSGLLNIRRRLTTDYAHAVLALTLTLVVVIYNYTEAVYKPLNNLFVLLLICLCDPRSQVARVSNATRKAAPETTAVLPSLQSRSYEPDRQPNSPDRFW